MAIFCLPHVDYHFFLQHPCQWLVKTLYFGQVIHYLALKSFLTQCSRQPLQINQNCHMKWNLSAICTLQWVVDRDWMENSEFLALSLGSFLSPSHCLLTSDQFFKISLVILEKSLISITKVSKSMRPLRFWTVSSAIMCFPNFDINHWFKCYQFGYYLNQW